MRPFEKGLLRRKAHFIKSKIESEDIGQKIKMHIEF
jgi:hypothetical protein